MKIAIRLSLPGNIIFIFLLLINTFVYLAGCAQIEGVEAFRVESVWPSSEDSVSSPSDVKVIKVVFNTNVAMETVWGKITVKRIYIPRLDEEEISVKIRQGENARTLEIIPLETWGYGKICCSLERGIESFQGVDLKKRYEWEFMIGNDATRPFLTNVVFVYGQNSLTNLVDVRFFFSESLSEDSIRNAFSLSPSSLYFIEYDDSLAMVRVYSPSSVEWGVYTLTVANSLKDKSSHQLKEGTNISFSLGERDKVVHLVGVYTNGGGNLLGTIAISNVDKYAKIEFRFDSFLDKNQVESMIEIFPFVSYRTEVVSNRLWIVPSGKWNVEETYLVSLRKGIKDIYGNVSTNSYYQKFFVSNEFSYYLRITNFVCYDQSTNMWYPGEENAITMPPMGWSTTNVAVRLVFNGNYVPFSIFGNISIERVMGSGSDMPEIMNVVFGPDPMTLSFTIDGLLLDDKSLYLLRVRGGNNGIRDNYSNSLSSDLVYYFRVTNLE
ncbi:MAG: hypothetical protein HPY78_06760 [Brevinematales bacterium]|nr:hypothetical protein [Brevinematales bacterium]